MDMEPVEKGTVAWTPRKDYLALRGGHMLSAAYGANECIFQACLFRGTQLGNQRDNKIGWGLPCLETSSDFFQHICIRSGHYHSIPFPWRAVCAFALSPFLSSPFARLHSCNTSCSTVLATCFLFFKPWVLGRLPERFGQHSDCMGLAVAVKEPPTTDRLMSPFFSPAGLPAKKT